MKEIEDRFQALAIRLIRDNSMMLRPHDIRTITEFYALWRIRHSYRLSPVKDIQLNMIAVEKEVSKNDQELLEKAGILFVRRTGVPSRMFNGMSIHRDIDAYCASVGIIDWSLWKAAVGEIVSPDVCPALFVPLTPSFCLVASKQVSITNLQALADLNRSLVHYSESYYFAQDISSCLGLSLVRNDANQTNIYWDAKSPNSLSVC